MTSICAADSCSQSATNRCAGCKEVSYCSKGCQTSHWPLHRRTCTAAKKFNCFLLRARSPTTDAASSFDNISECVEPFHLLNYGTESGEIKELKQKLGWTSPYEIGKFYDHQGTDTWYYFVYGQTRGKEEVKPQNMIATKLCNTTPYGDVAIIRSGPANTHTPEEFTKATLVKTLAFYRTRSSSQVFEEGEKSRLGKKMGFDLSGVPSMHYQ